MALKTYPNSDINVISDEVKNYLKANALKAGESAKYRLLIGKANNDPDPKQREMRPFIYPSSFAIPLNGHILDPGSASGLAHIAVLRSYDKETSTPVYKKFIHQPNNSEYFTLRGHVAAEAEMYEALELSSFNKSNPFRDEAVEPIFERVDAAKEAKYQIQQDDILLKALYAVKQLKPTELRTLAAGYNIDTEQGTDVLVARLNNIAKNNPEKFYATLDSEDMKLKALVHHAKIKSVIGFNEVENKVTMGTEVLALLERREGVTMEEQFAEVLKAAANGPAMVKNIKKGLDAKEAKTTGEGGKSEDAKTKDAGDSKK